MYTYVWEQLVNIIKTNGFFHIEYFIYYINVQFIYRWIETLCMYLQVKYIDMCSVYFRILTLKCLFLCFFLLIKVKSSTLRQIRWTINFASIPALANSLLPWMRAAATAVANFPPARLVLTPLNLPTLQLFPILKIPCFPNSMRVCP